MRGARLLAVGALATGFLLAQSPAGAGAVEPPLVFAAGPTLKATWAELATGKSFTVCNGAGESVQPTVFLSEFRSSKKQDAAEVAAPVDGVLTAALTPNPLGGGKCGALEVKASTEAGISGGLSGFVLLVAPGEGVARAELELSDSPPPKAAPVSGASEEARLSAINEVPWSDGDLQDGGDLLLKRPLPEEGEIAVGATCPEVGEERKPPARCPFLGNLYNGEEIVHVYVAGHPRVETGVVRLPVRIWPQAHLVGNYEGSLDPAGTGEKDDLVKVKLTGSDSWASVLFFVLLGAVLTLVAQWIAQRHRPKKRLEQRKQAIAAAYGSKGSPASVPDHPALVASVDQVKEYLEGSEGVQAAIEAYSESVLFLATESDAYKAIDASLVLAEKDAQVLVDPKKLAAALGALQTAIDGAGAGVDATSAGGGEEAILVGLARSLAADGELGVGEASERAKRAKELTAVLGEWEKLALWVRRCELWALAIAAASERGVPGTPLSQEERKQLREEWIATRAIRSELNHANGAADVERLRSSGRIESAFSTIAFLGRKCEVPMPESLGGLSEDEQAAGEDLLAGKRRRYMLGLRPRVKPEERAAAAAVVGAPSKKLWRITSTVAIDLSVLVVGMLPAVVLALAAVYFGKNFGTFEDYLQVVGAGAVGQALVKLVQDNFSIFFHDVRAEKGLRPAVFSLPAPQPAPTSLQPASP